MASMGRCMPAIVSSHRASEARVKIDTEGERCGGGRRLPVANRRVFRETIRLLPQGEGGARSGERVSASARWTCWPGVWRRRWDTSAIDGTTASRRPRELGKRR